VARDGTVSRLALLKAGLSLAEKGGLAALSVNEVVRQAGLAKGTFYVHFSTRDDFLAALHDQFHSELEASIDHAVSGSDRPEDRLRRGIAAYLDGCLAASGVKTLLQDVRSETSIMRQVRQRDRAFADRIAAALHGLGWPLADECGRLFVAMIASTAVAELDAGEQLPALRRALFFLLHRQP
jgi:AcrR family transcriptional regulator